MLQDGQVRDKALAHWPQNRLVAGLSAPHAAHAIAIDARPQSVREPPEPARVIVTCLSASAGLFARTAHRHPLLSAWSGCWCRQFVEAGRSVRRVRARQTTRDTVDERR